MWFCIIKEERKKAAVDVLELRRLRDGLECGVRGSVTINSATLLDCLHFLLLLLHIISLTTLISGYFKLLMQHLRQAWVRIIGR